jgi:hypothetical protein
MRSYSHTGLSNARRCARPDNAPAQAAYARWGWRNVTKLKPFPDAPVYDALILPLAPRIARR